jgi:O-antigen/teichoic acid export membrane protein
VKSRVLVNTSYRLLADVGGKVGSVVLFIFMGRELGDTTFGVFTFAYALVALLTSLADFGQDKVLTREVARDPRALDRYFLNTIALKVTVAVPALALGIGGLVLSGRDRQTVAVAALLGGAILVELLTGTIYGTFQAFERLEFVPVALISERLVTAGGGIALLLLGAGVVPVSAAFLAGAVLAFAIASRLLVRHVARPRLTLDVSRWVPLMRAAAPIGLAGIAGVILFRVDTLMLAAFKSSEVVGNYGAAYRLFESTLFLSWAVGAAVYPVYSRRSGHTLTGVYERSLKLLLAITLPFAVGAAILGPQVIQLLYGDDFESAGTALQLLAPTIVLYGLGYLSGYLLVSQERPLVLTVVYGAVAVENVLANLVLIPVWSLNGAAAGTSISELLATTALLWWARGVGGSASAARVVAGPAVAALAAGAAMWLLRDELWAAVAGGGLAYAAVLFAFERAIFPRDAVALWSQLRPGRG